MLLPAGLDTICRRCRAGLRRSHLGGVLCLTTLIAAPAAATVYEWGSDGELIIDGDRQDTTAPEPAPSRETLSTKSPGTYRALAREVALRHAGKPGIRRVGLDALGFARLFTQLVRFESAFDPRAVSSAGAQGLGQLMPATARRLGVTDPFDPEQNLDGAARYLSAQLARFGDVRLALAAYNAGPHRVARYGGIPPFRETRSYVAKISAAVGLRPTADRAPAAVTATQTPPDSERTQSVWDY